MAKSITLGDDIISLAAEDSARQRHSIADQVTHWALIGGRAAELRGHYNHVRLIAVLEGRNETTVLSDVEKEIWLNLFSDAMSVPTDKGREFFLKRKRIGQGVGLSKIGQLVYAKDKQ